MENDTLLEKVTEVDGCRVLGPCAIYSRLGQGGRGAVYRARHMYLGIHVAVKCLKPPLADAQFVEAKSAARIGHQNVVRVFDVAEDQGLFTCSVQGLPEGENDLRDKRPAAMWFSVWLEQRDSPCSRMLDGGPADSTFAALRLAPYAAGQESRHVRSFH